MPILRRPCQQFALWLAMAAVALRAMIPDGFMLERSTEDGEVGLAFCYAGPLATLRTDDGAMAHLHDHGMAGHAQHDPAHHHDGEDHASCAFASAAATGLPASAPGLLSFAAQMRPLSAFAASAVLAAARLRPPSRGPPRYS
jgi:hypothetical protein